MKIIDKLAWIHLENHKILSTRSKGKDTFYIPGGKREAGESDHETLLREIKEELSVDLKKETLVHFGNFEAQAHGHAEGILVKMTCYTGAFKGTLEPAAEIEEMQWLDSSDMNKISPVDKIIFKYLKDRNLIT